MGRLQGGGAIQVDDTELVARFVADLIVRTRVARISVTSLGREVLQTFLRGLDDPDVAPRMGSPVQRDMARAFLKLVPEEAVARDARDAQLRFLRETRVEREERLKALRWSVEHIGGSALILGELGPVARFQGSDVLQAPLRHRGETFSVFLPIASTKLLVGRASTDDAAAPSPEELNTAAAELSHDLFVASASTGLEKRYAAMLGRRSELFTPDELYQKMKEDFGVSN